MQTFALLQYMYRKARHPLCSFKFYKRKYLPFLSLEWCERKYSPFFSTEVLTVFKLKNPKVRIGKDNDGGYVILDGFSYDLLIGCGISDDNSFETQFVEKYNVDCFAFDGSITALPDPYPQITFVKKYISAKNNRKNTDLHDLIDSHRNIFLKMDIDEGEYNWISTLTKDQLNAFRQIVIEFHLPFNKKRVQCLKQLADTHYLCHLHGNNHCGTRVVNGIEIPIVFECTYVRKKDIQYTPSLNDENIPSSIDMKNKINKEEIHLSGYPYINSPAKVDG